MDSSSKNNVDLYGVVGNPIKHSKSPIIHQLFAEQFGHNIQYDRIESPLEAFEECVRGFFAQERGCGLNVTVPFKERAFAICDGLSDRAELAGAVNTLYLSKDGKIIGDNTDGVGLVNDISQNNGVELSGKRVLVVGAGGAVRGVLGPLLQEKPSKLVVCNRTESKVDTLIEIFKDIGEIEKSTFEALDKPFDIVINGTSASLGGSLPPLPTDIIAPDTVVYDMMYSAEMTIFNSWARDNGAALMLDGLGMLVEQAAEAFEIWREARPETINVIKSLRNQ